MKNKHNLLFFLLILSILINFSITQSEEITESKENYYYINFDTSYYFPDSIINTFYKYSIMEYCNKDSSQLEIDTFLATQPVQDYDDSLYHYIYCSKNCCYILIRNIFDPSYIDTFYYTCSDSINEWFYISIPPYDIDIETNNLLFTELDSIRIIENKMNTNQDIDFIMETTNSTCFTTLNSQNNLDTIKIFKNTEYASFTNDKSQILLTTKQINQNYHTVSMYDIETDSLYKLNNEDSLRRLNPQKISKKSPIYYQRFNPPYVNIYKYDFDKMIEVQITNLTKFHVRDYYLFGDSLIYYYYVNNNLDDLRDKIIQLK